MKKKLNVLHLLSSNKYSGAENVACTIINNTQENSYYCSLNGPIEENINEKHISFIGLNKFRVKDLKKVIKEYNIDVIHAHDYKASFLASFVGNNVKVISHLHSNFDFAKKWNIYTIVYNLVQKRFYKIIVVSKEILNDCVFKKSIVNKTEVIENVVDPVGIKQLSKEYKTPKYDLIFVGRLIDIKQPLLFIDIVNNLKKKNKDIKACILGQGDMYDSCKEKILADNLTNNINLVGFKSNPFPYVKNSKLEVLPSKYEGLPMSTIEAMILGVPVINSGVGGLSSMFKNYPKYICRNMNEYIDCIEKLLEDKNEDYKKDCSKLIVNFTDIDSYSKKIEKIYRG